MKKTSILSFGELVVDLTPAGMDEHNMPLYEFNPGGAPANVASAAAHLGLNAALISKVGNDSFGHTLCDFMNTRGVHIDGISFSMSASTSLAIVHLNANGERSFSLYAHQPADGEIQPADLPFDLIDSCSIFHFGARSLSFPITRNTLLMALKAASENGARISFDPNLRPNLWKDAAYARADALLGIGMADIVKLSLEEMEWVFETQSVSQVLQEMDKRGKLCIITDGAQGCWGFENSSVIHVPAYGISVCDTTGAGDAFWAAFLYQQLLSPSSSLAQQLVFASAAGALVAMQKGSMYAQPTVDEIEKMMKEYRHEQLS